MRALPPFQSTLPMKGVTRQGEKSIQHLVVSIHTPNEGSDARAQAEEDRMKAFQSTLPMKGVTPASYTQRAG